jgi:sodium transport system permease protein|tara:strand:- start:1143 stop:2315 length:1173 start_codon:yes stop_codon:yes gene_type:complete
VNFAAAGTVFKKELTDGIRDRRAVMTAMVFPILGPAMIYFMFNALIDLRKDLEEIEVAVIGREHAPAMIDWLTQHNVTFKDVTEDPKQAVRDKIHDMVLVIPAGFQHRFAQSRSAVVELVNDGSRTDARNAVGQIRNLITSYGRQIGAFRLVSRGVSPEITQAVIVQNIEAASKQQIAARILNVIPMYIVLAAFVCGMGLAVDSTAGERERATLEALLINPVRRTQIVIGKWLAASLFAAVGILLTLFLCFFTLKKVPLEEIGLSFTLGWGQIVGMLAAVFPLAFMATGLQLLLGIFAKSFKDAQSYIGVLVLIPVLPGIIGTLYPIQGKAWMNLVPALGQHILLMDVVGGKAPAIWNFVVSGITALLVALVCVKLTAYLFRRERIIFSR